MGFFDNILKDITSGELDKKLEKLADKIEYLSDKLDGSVKKVADKPQETSQKLDQTSSTVKKILS